MAQRPSDKTFGHQFSAEFLAKYEVTGVLGEGGMGQVLRGRQTALGRDVAIKFLTNRSYATPERRQRFKDEAQRCAGMRHPNLVEVYDYGEEGERPYMVMELIDGESLADRVKREGKVPIREALQIGIDICAGLEYAHGLGLVHRDIKPDNILLDRKERKVKVADFGIATEQGGGSEKENVIIGTPSYMSPEQASGRKADGRSDIYSTGVILYEMLAGKVPFTGETSMAIIIKHLNEQAASLRDLNPGVPPQLEEIIMRSLEKEPERRYQSANELSSQLKKAGSLLDSWVKLAKESKPGMRSSTSVMMPLRAVAEVSEEEKRQKRLMVSLAAVAGLAVAGSLGWWLFLAPPTFAITEASGRSGFTQAEVTWRTNHPCRSKVQFREPPDGAIQEVAGEGTAESTQHTVLLEGLKEDVTYLWRPVFPYEQEAPWQELHTQRLDFSGIQMEPRVNGAEIRWKTSLPVEMEIEYLQEGKVREISRLEGVRSEHVFKASFADPSIPYQLRLRALLSGKFQKTHLLEEVPSIDLAEIDRLSKSIQKVVHSDQHAFYRSDVFESFKEQKIAEKLERFQKVRDLFYRDPQVRPEDRMQLVYHLDRLRELDLFVTWAGPALELGTFATGAEKGYGPGYLTAEKPPFQGGKSVDVLSRPKDMVFDADPPPDPITGDRPEDAKDSAKFEIGERVVEDPEEAYLEISVRDVAHNCYFSVELGHGRKRADVVVGFLPPAQRVKEARPYSGTFYARIDPRFLNPRKPVYGWVRLKFLRGTVSNQEALARVRGGFRSLKLVHRK